MLDVEPATRVLAALIAGVSDDQLGSVTPCPDMTMGDLLDHVDRLSLAFAAAAAKQAPEGGLPPPPDASNLGEDWRTRIPAQLAALAEAWHDEAAWAGETHIVGTDLPAELAGTIAIDEVVVHGWDVAVASGQRFTSEPQLLEAAYGFAQATAAQNPDGTPGLFGPPVQVPDDAPLLDRLLGLTGRDPQWAPR